MKIISPIAIDMGAKNTGVYYAKYKEGSTFEQIEKHGQVLVYGNYTSLLKERTANRHSRRGYQRKKLAKRLLTLVLENYFNFPAKQHSQAIGFLLNRRGFTFLDEEYSKERLNEFPDDAWKMLPEEVRSILENKKNIVQILDECVKKEPEKIGEILKCIESSDGVQRVKKLKSDMVYFTYINKIVDKCQYRADGNMVTEKGGDRNKLSQTSKWIVERLVKETTIPLLTFTQNAKQTAFYDLKEHVNGLGAEQAVKFKKQLPDVSQSIKKAKAALKESNWDFDFQKFTFDDKHEEGLMGGDVKIHLQHFCYAIDKINTEITSGARHRSKFFKEIEGDLEKFQSPEYQNNKHAHKYLKEFAKEVVQNSKLGRENLTRLVCHTSNLELKPLRAYFNDSAPILRSKNYEKSNQTKSNFISHKNDGGEFSKEKLSRVASTWFLKHWMVNEEKDGKDKVTSHTELKRLWEQHSNKDDVIAFWLKTCPTFTIPPYQSMTNRKPPGCQSLMLNGNYLEEYYPQWKDWLAKLQPNEEYKEKLQSLQSVKGKRKNKDGRLIDDESIQLRQLQFILDTAKQDDSYKLNEIWSIHHKLQQLKKGKDQWESKLAAAVNDSKLPREITDDLDFIKQDSFWHFVNKYYQTRRKARDGRYFLIQEKKEKWIAEGMLLILCPHKPKQKKRQWDIDLAAVLGIDKKELKDVLATESNSNTPEEYFHKIKSTCNRATKAQKEHRGELKYKISMALTHSKYDKKSLSSEAKDLLNLANKCADLKDELNKATRIANFLVDKKTHEIDQKIALVFKFAQIDNIIFKERSGFSKTCPVCSTDNAFRMQENERGAFASRLPAMSIRLIDGVVMRICDAISRQVARTKWTDIENDVEQGKKVTIPLILEQNRFEFEPSLAKIKGRTLITTDNRETAYNKKKTRIEKAAKGICAYKGTPLGENGEIDHIIPQSSQYGTLNDEANLIYVSKMANQGKSNHTYDLSGSDGLHKNYKNIVFDKKSDDEIKQFIYEQLEGEDAEVGVANVELPFCFGKYLSFVNLNDAQKNAFRHALFLADTDPLKQKVLKSLQNRNRTIVNGTQRYLAQCIADKIYRIAKNVGKEKQLKFDYFEYTAKVDDPKSTYNLRKMYGLIKPKKQPLYSHLIDAQLAFLIAVQDHQAAQERKNGGSMGIKFENNQRVWEFEYDKETGEVLPGKLFNVCNVGEDNFSAIKLDRKKANVREHRSFHRPNFYAQNYIPCFFGKKGEEIEIKAGFSWENSATIKQQKGTEKNILDILHFAKNEFVANSKFESLEDLYRKFNKKTKQGEHDVFYVDWDKTKIQKYLIDEYSTKDMAAGKKWSQEITFLMEFSYRAQKQTIKNIQDIRDALNGMEIGKAKPKPKSYFSIKLFSKNIELPVRSEWVNLLNAWEQKKKSNEGSDDFLRNYFNKSNTAEHKHQKVRKVFSLPVANELGHFLQKRQSWNGDDSYQISADSDSRKDNNKFSRIVLMNNGELKKVINHSFVSPKTFKLKFEDVETDQNYREIDPNQWIKIHQKDGDFPCGVESIEYKIDNATRPQVKIYLSNNFKKDIQVNSENILKSPLTKAKVNSELKKKLTSEDVNNTIEYTASGFNKEIKGKLSEVLS